MPNRVHQIRRIERAALGFAPRGRLFEKRLVAEETHALLDGKVLAVQANGDDEPRETHQGLRELPEPDRDVTPPETGFHHHVLAVVGPALDEGRRREEGGLTDLRVDLTQMTEVEEVPRIHLVNRDVPQRRNVEVAKVFLLAIRRPASIDVGQIVVRPTRLALEGPRGPHACEGPPVEIWRRGNDHRL